MTVLSLEELHALGVKALVACNTAPAIAAEVMDALVAAEASGQSGHGASRIPTYAIQAKAGKVDGHALPKMAVLGPSSLRIDAQHGFAYPAMRMALDAVAERAGGTGIAIAVIARSHHFGQAGHHAEKLAERGLIALIFGNAPSAIAPWGGSKPIFGTNPIAFAAPRQNGEAPLVIDLSLSKVARGKVMAAKQKGERIPEGWAVDADGNPTTDPDAALAGSMLPMGDAKGAALVLMVEILAAALTGSNAAFEASSLFDAKGPPPSLGQVVIAIDPTHLSGGQFPARLEAILQAMLAQEGVRLPGIRRLAAREKARQQGITIHDGLLAEIQALSE